MVRGNAKAKAQEKNAKKQAEKTSAKSSLKIERVFSFEVSRVHGVDEEREADEGTFREQTSESGNACGVQRRGDC